MGRRRWINVFTVAAGALVFVASAFQAYDAPTPARLDAAAEASLERARQALRSDRPPVERFTTYRDASREAEDRLVRAVRSAPQSGRRLLRIAELRHELDRPATPHARDRIMALVELAVAVEPANPRLRLRAADLAFALSRRELGLGELHHALALDPGLAADALERLTRRGWTDREVLLAAAPSAALLAAMAPGITDELREPWLAAVEALRGPPMAELLRGYGRHGRQAQRLGETASHLERLGALDRAQDEVERLIQLAACLVEMDAIEDAIAAARRASAVGADDPRAARYLGRVALRAGEHEMALAAFEDALGRAARAARPAAERAGLYGWQGVAHEARGRPDLALIAFRRARRLDPAEPFSSRYLDDGGRR